MFYIARLPALWHTKLTRCVTSLPQSVASVSPEVRNMPEKPEAEA